MNTTTRDRSRTGAGKDDDAGVVWFAEECRSNHVRFEALLRLAERVRDPELAEFFRRAQAVSFRLSNAQA
jgi:hypothetical protein